MARYDMVWYSKLRYGMVYDMVWHGLLWYVMVCYDMVWCGMVYDMVWHGLLWYVMVCYDMVWCGVAWYGMVWYGMVWYGMVCHSYLPISPVGAPAVTPFRMPFYKQIMKKHLKMITTLAKLAYPTLTLSHLKGSSSSKFDLTDSLSLYEVVDELDPLSSKNSSSVLSERSASVPSLWDFSGCTSSRSPSSSLTSVTLTSPADERPEMDTSLLLGELSSQKPVCLTLG